MLHDAKPRGYPTSVSHTGRAWPPERPWLLAKGWASSQWLQEVTLQVSDSPVCPSLNVNSYAQQGSRLQITQTHFPFKFFSGESQKYFILPRTPTQEQSSPVTRVASTRQVELGQWVQPLLFQALSAPNCYEKVRQPISSQKGLPLPCSHHPCTRYHWGTGVLAASWVHSTGASTKPAV